MDASPLSPALLCELSDLRRQAYGPDDGAAMDRNALRRLGELEGMLHPLLATDARRVPPRVDLPMPVLAPQAAPATRERNTEHARDAELALRSLSAVPRSRWTQARMGRITALALATAVFFAGAALVATAPRGAALLIATPATGLERQQIVDAVDLESFGLIGARLQQ